MNEHSVINTAATANFIGSDEIGETSYVVNSQQSYGKFFIRNSTFCICILRHVIRLITYSLAFFVSRRKLVSRGLIRVEKAGRESHMTVIDADKVSDLLIVYRRSFLDKLVDELAKGKPMAKVLRS